MGWFRHKEKKSPPNWVAQRARMVRRDLLGRDIEDRAVLDAMEQVPRERFVPPAKRDLAYADHALPIGHLATISQPYVVALTLQLARPKPTDRLLEVGTGCGYAAAVASRLVSQVYTVEHVEPLALGARARLETLGYDNIVVGHRDGSLGWMTHAPFDVIVAAAAPREVPKALLEQLAPGGRMVIPVGEWRQRLWIITKDREGVVKQTKGAAVTFVPMMGAARAPTD